MSGTPNMNLTLPVPGVTPGGTASTSWAPELNAAFNIIDAHDHSSGEGALITPFGMNITSDLTFNSNNITNLRATKFSTVPSTIGDLNCIYDVSGDLYWNNSSGVAIRLTSGSSLAAVPTSSIFGTLTVNGSIAIGATDTYGLYLVNTAASQTLTLPSAATCTAGKYFVIKDIFGAAETYNIVLSPNGADKIDNANTAKSLKINKGSWMVMCDGSANWYVSYMAIDQFVQMFQIGDTPAQSGTLRMGTQASMYWRNAANSADVNMIAVDGSNQLTLSGSGTNTVIKSSMTQFGSLPAATGILALPNSTNITFRNTANAADIQVLNVDSSDIINIGNNTNFLRLNSGSGYGVAVQSGGTTFLTIASSLGLYFDKATTAAITHATKTTDSATTGFAIAAQSAYSSATVNKNGASLGLQAGLPASGGTYGTVSLMAGNAITLFRAGFDGTNSTYEFLGAKTAITVGAAGSASILPAQPLGYLLVYVAGSQVKIPYYNL